MQAEIDSNLERLIHQELRKLPPVKAPEGLPARVLLAVRARQAWPWWQQSIWHWPNFARTTFMILLSIAVAAMTSSTWWATEVASNFAPNLAPATQMFSTLGNAMAVLWKTVLQNVMLYGLAVVAMLYLFCLGAGTMFVRLAVRRS